MRGNRAVRACRAQRADIDIHVRIDGVSPARNDQAGARKPAARAREGHGLCRRARVVDRQSSGQRNVAFRLRGQRAAQYTPRPTVECSVCSGDRAVRVDRGQRSD
ncbi:hypothetical protein SDC9_106820 [bioreactor metagenome]|uniref:Uncharacterized protein n=1 Tax=bioreactor metagenome TaxID=1076179 RepID=A0A645BE40_9ZZZZ